jgi:hypothetical protein
MAIVGFVQRALFEAGWVWVVARPDKCAGEHGSREGQGRGDQQKS